MVADKSPKSFAERAFEALSAARTANHGTLSRAEWIKIVDDLAAELVAPTPKTQKRDKPKLAGDEVFLRECESRQCYEGVDVRRELGKAQAWASIRGVGVSQRRFLNWLNKAASDAPMRVNGAGQSSKPSQTNARGFPEPAGWQTWVTANSIDPTNATRPWASLTLAEQQYISGKMTPNETNSI